MKEFTIIIEEIVSQPFVVEAESAEEAMQTAEDKYHNGEFVLEPGALICKQMAIVEPDDEVTEWTEF